MGKLKKIELEYLLRTSPGVLYPFLAEPTGLAEWFCNDVNTSEGNYTFVWDKDSEETARLIASRENAFVRYRWQDAPENSYFEMRLQVDDITSELALIITEFVEEDDVDETVLFWDNAMQRLHQVIGS